MKKTLTLIAVLTSLLLLTLVAGCGGTAKKFIKI